MAGIHQPTGKRFPRSPSAPFFGQPFRLSIRTRTSPLIHPSRRTGTCTGAHPPDPPGVCYCHPKPGGTRHHEMARELVQKGHTVTIIASPVSYLTGKRSGHRVQAIRFPGRARTGNHAHPRLHLPCPSSQLFPPVISFFSFMLSSFIACVRGPKCGPGLGYIPADIPGIHCLAGRQIKRMPLSYSKFGISGLLSPLLLEYLKTGF